MSDDLGHTTNGKVLPVHEAAMESKIDFVLQIIINYVTFTH